MITQDELQTLYEWGKVTTFPLKKVPTAIGYSNKDIYLAWLKGAGKRIMIRRKLMTDKVIKIFENEDIIYSTYSIFHAGTILNPHKDPDVYPHPYKRIQLPLNIPDKDKCYMNWQGKRVSWEEGVAQCYPVMDYVHDGGNISDESMDFIMLDVKHETEVEI